jgi:hypothetical protein
VVGSTGGNQRRAATTAWFDELDLAPGSTPLQMALRRVRDRPWLVIDDRRRAELALRAELLEHRRAEVLALDQIPAEVGREVEGLVMAELATLGAGSRAPMDRRWHGLERAGRSVQEDLCLMRKEPAGWVLAGAVLCFPSRWRLADKLGQPLTAIHHPVEGYREALAAKVNRFFDRLGPEPVWRRNWFVHPDSSLFQPNRPPGGDPVIPSERALDELWVRSEYQTLRALRSTGWILFTIRIQQDPLSALLTTAERRARFRAYLEAAPAPVLAHRGLGADQVAALSGPVRESLPGPADPG